MSLALILSPNDTFVDIGANVGLYAAQIAKLQAVYPRLRIYAFEAHPETAGRLRESMIGRNVVIHAIALSAKQERLAFVGGAVSFVFGSAGHDRTFQRGRVIANLDARPLDSFPIEGDALVLKIDVEGHEREVLAGASGFLETNRIKAVYLDGYEDRTIPESLERLGFRLFDGRSLKAERPEFSLLAIHTRHLAQ
jgi:FkbM family methyltransferase